MLSLIRSAITSIPALRVLCALAVTAAAGCATKPVAFKNLESAAQLQLSSTSERPYQYRDAASGLAHYTKLLIDPVTVYTGADAQFGSVAPQDRRALADYVQHRFSAALDASWQPVQTAQPGALRLHLTLLGARSSVPVLSTASHLAPIGLVANAVLELSHDPGTFYGSASYAVELFDAQTGKLIWAYVEQRSAHALDITSSFRGLDAARAGVRHGATELASDLRFPAGHDTVATVSLTQR
jgi:hypothetical protein